MSIIWQEFSAPAGLISGAIFGRMLVLFWLYFRRWAHSSVVERVTDNDEVLGPIPSAPTLRLADSLSVPFSHRVARRSALSLSKGFIHSPWAVSSAVEHLICNEGVGGSNPPRSTGLAINYER